MRIGLDMLRPVAGGHVRPEPAGKVLDALSLCDGIDEVVVVVGGGTASGQGRRPRRHIRPHPFFASLPRLWRNLRLPKHLDRNGVDVYHALDGEIPWRMAVSRQRLVVSVRDVGFLLRPAAFPAWERMAKRLRCYVSCRMAHRIVVPDERSRRALCDFGAEAGKITVVRPYVDEWEGMPPSEAERAAVREKYALFGRYILLLGDAAAYGGCRNAIEALAEVAAEGDRETGLVICCRRTARACRLLEHARACGIGARVNLIYEIGHADLAAVASMSSGVLFLSDEDRSTASLVRAMRLGLPVVASPTERNAATAGDAALYVDPSSAGDIAEVVRRLVRDDTSALREASRKRSRLFSAEAAAKRLAAIYESLRRV